MRETVIVTEGEGMLPDDWLVIVLKNGWVYKHIGDATVGVKTESGLILIDVDKGEIYPDYLGGR